MKYPIFFSAFSFSLVAASLASVDELRADGFSLSLSKLLTKEQRPSRPWRKLFIGKGTGLEGFWKRSIFQSFGRKAFELPLTLFVLYSAIYTTPPPVFLLFSTKIPR